MIFNDFCKEKNCPQRIEWEFEGNNFVSCKLIGQSSNIEKYPHNCLFLDEIKKYESEQQKNDSDDFSFYM
jgi:hypothetical protein